MAALSNKWKSDPHTPRRSKYVLLNTTHWNWQVSVDIKKPHQLSKYFKNITKKLVLFVTSPCPFPVHCWLDQVAEPASCAHTKASQSSAVTVQGLLWANRAQNPAGLSDPEGSKKRHRQVASHKKATLGNATERTASDGKLEESRSWKEGKNSKDQVFRRGLVIYTGINQLLSISKLQAVAELSISSLSFTRHDV